VVAVVVRLRQVVVTEHRVRVDQVVGVTVVEPVFRVLTVHLTLVEAGVVEPLQHMLDVMAVKVLSSFATSINRRIIWLITQN
jgi:hypothetical protein